MAFRFRLKSKNWFSRWPPWWLSWISDRNILAIFDLQVTPMLPTKFQVNWPFGTGEEAINRFQDGRHGGHLGFPVGTVLSYFWSTCHPDASYLVSSRRLGSGGEAKNRFSRWPPSWISDCNNLAFVDLQVTPMLPIKFPVNLFNGCRKCEKLAEGWTDGLWTTGDRISWPGVCSRWTKNDVVRGAGVSYCHMTMVYIRRG